MNGMPSEAVIQETIDDILASPEFQPRGEGFVSRLLRLLDSWLDGLFQAAGEIAGIPVVLLIVFAVLAVLLGWGLAKRFRHSRVQGGDRGEVRDIWDTPDPWRAAMRFAESGAFGKGLACLFVGHLQALDARGLIAVEKNKTNAQYEGELIQSRYDGIGEFREFKNLFHAVRYGSREIDKSTFDAWRGYCLSSSGKEGGA